MNDSIDKALDDLDDLDFNESIVKAQPKKEKIQGITANQGFQPIARTNQGGSSLNISNASKWSGSSGKSTKPLDYYRGQARYRVGQSTNLSTEGELPPLAKKPSISYFPVFGNNTAKNKVAADTGPTYAPQFGRRAHLPGRTDWTSKYNRS